MFNNIPGKSVGFILKEARASKNLSIEQASKNTKIHVKILKDLEADNFTSIGAVYAKSFLKIYSEYLGLNKDEATRYFELISPSERPALKIPKPSSGDGFKLLYFLKKINFRVLIILVIAVFLIFGFVKFARHRKIVTPVVKKTEVKKTEVKKAQVKEAVTVLKSVSKALPAKKPKNELVLKPDAAVTAQKTEKLVLTIKARSKSWLQVKSDGKVIFQGILSKGSAETWDAKEKIELWLADAGAVQLEFNGKLFEKIGRPGQTLKHVILNKSGLSVQR